MGVFHAIALDGSSWRLPERGGDCRREGPVAVKETILDLEQTNSVSMPSALFVDAGAGAGLLALRAGRVKLRRMWVALAAGRSACSGVFEGAGDDMAGASGGHCGAVVVAELGTRGASRGQRPAGVRLGECVEIRGRLEFPCSELGEKGRVSH